MQSTFSGIEIGKRSLVAHNQGLVTTGHNLGNASTEGYSRQRVQMESFDPLYAPGLNREETPGQIGQGVSVARIERVKDMMLEGRIVSESNQNGYWTTRDNYVLMLEQVYNEPTEVSSRTLMDKFWDSWQELSVNPDESAARQAVVERGQAFVDSVRNKYGRLKETRDMINADIKTTVGQVNALSKEVAKLNEEIVKVKAMGDNPNDLMDRRDLMVNKLSKLVNVTIDDRDPDEFMVHTNGQVLVQGKIARGFELVTDKDNEGYEKVIWNETKDDAHFTGGSLGALIELRDSDVREEIQRLDELSLNFTDLVNETHRAGFGSNGSTGLDFFTNFSSVNNITGNYDRNGDGAFDSTYLHRFSGTNSLVQENLVGLAGTMTFSSPEGNVEVNYKASDTVGDVVERINNSGAEVTARLDRLGRLELRASAALKTENPDFVLRHVEDSGAFLTGYAGVLKESGEAGAYDFATSDAVNKLNANSSYALAPLAHPSGWFNVNAEIKRDLTSLAAGFGENGRKANSGDGSAALAISSLRNNPVMVGNLRTFDDHFADAVARIGLKGETAGRALETSERVLKDLTTARESISGVNIDEELSQMIKFQHGYAAAARFISNFNEMLDTIINRMGV